MTVSHIHGRFRTVPATLLLETLGHSLGAIKAADGATDADLGQVLGKSADRAAAYRSGLADMGMVSFLRGCREWDGRFANAALALVGMRLAPIDTAAASACDGPTALKALGALIAKKAEALEDGLIDDDELEAMWPQIEAVAAHIDRLRARRAGRAILIGKGEQPPP